jgi:hypothetical protein
VAGGAAVDMGYLPRGEGLGSHRPQCRHRRTFRRLRKVRYLAEFKWSGRRDSNSRPSAPKAVSSIYRNLLKLIENKCFRLNALRPTFRALLLSKVLGGSDRYDFDYTQNSSRRA